MHKLPLITALAIAAIATVASAAPLFAPLPPGAPTDMPIDPGDPVDPDVMARPKVTTITCTLRGQERYCTSADCHTKCRVDDCTSVTITHNGVTIINPSFVAWDSSKDSCITVKPIQ